MTGLQHAALETRRADVEACVAFFALLGFERVPVPPGLVEIAEWVARDGTQIHLLFRDDPVVPPHGHVAVVCPDYADAVGRLEGAGFAVTDAARHWGSPRGFATDPAGHRVEIMEFSPPA